MSLKSDDGNNPWIITTTNIRSERDSSGIRSEVPKRIIIYTDQVQIATITLETCTRGKRKGIDRIKWVSTFVCQIGP